MAKDNMGEISRWRAITSQLDLQYSLRHLTHTILILLATLPFLKNSDGLQIRPSNGKCVESYISFI